jgi:hypothetical protein
MKIIHMQYEKYVLDIRVDMAILSYKASNHGGKHE